jgi:hypothetical protein
MLKSVYDPRGVENDTFVKVQDNAPDNPFKGMLWYDSSGLYTVGTVLSTLDNSQYIGVI